MCGEEHRRATGNLVEIVHKRNAPITKAANDMLVVDDLVVDEDRLAVADVKKLIDDVDGHVDAGTAATGVRENQLHRRVGSRSGDCRIIAMHDDDVSGRRRWWRSWPLGTVCTR